MTGIVKGRKAARAYPEQPGGMNQPNRHCSCLVIFMVMISALDLQIGQSRSRSMRKAEAGKYNSRTFCEKICP